jgi:hypothetical protein
LTKPERSNLSGFCMFAGDIHEKGIEWCKWRGGSFTIPSTRSTSRRHSSGLPLHDFMSLKFFAICPDHLTKTRTKTDFAPLHRQEEPLIETPALHLHSFQQKSRPSDFALWFHQVVSAGWVTVKSGTTVGKSLSHKEAALYKSMSR